ncbi:MAG: hypothetical protein QOJ85_3312, partial [Solirubrobacteraceae bacterium]|nr:hypothetical protein [Solirubrobacteraceae bacterium]
RVLAVISVAVGAPVVGLITAREEVKIMLHLLELVPVLGPVVQVVLSVEHGTVEATLVVVTIARALLGL